ncbi:hypothetical protein RCH33_2024 [Flavobacterium daejeonense]|nr:hypothetical protein RCH33_2024 [Flavobacterium daejeonense]
MRINDIEQFFEGNVPKKSLTEISLDKENNVSVVSSAKEVFDFDTILDNTDINEGTKEKIKTSDTIYFKDGKVIFVEFKRGKISETDFRLKATESIISFYNYIFEKGFKEKLCFPSDLFQIYVVYDKRNTSLAARLPFFRNTERKLQIKYKHLFSKYQVIDNDKFQRIFKI